MAFVRLARGPSLADRVIAYDLLAAFRIAILAGCAVVTGETAFLDVGPLPALVNRRSRLVWRPGWESRVAAAAKSGIRAIHVDTDADWISAVDKALRANAKTA